MKGGDGSVSKSLFKKRDPQPSTIFKHRPRPHLALSIVGGAKNFHMDGRKKETFKVNLICAVAIITGALQIKAGLIGAARATNAWVLSGGTNTGVMKLVSLLQNKLAELRSCVSLVHFAKIHCAECTVWNKNNKHGW